MIIYANGRRLVSGSPDQCREHMRMTRYYSMKYGRNRTRFGIDRMEEEGQIYTYFSNELNKFFRDLNKFTGN